MRHRPIGPVCYIMHVFRGFNLSSPVIFCKHKNRGAGAVKIQNRPAFDMKTEKNSVSRRFRKTPRTTCPDLFHESADSIDNEGKRKHDNSYNLRNFQHHCVHCFGLVTACNR